MFKYTDLDKNRNIVQPSKGFLHQYLYHTIYYNEIDYQSYITCTHHVLKLRALCQH